MRKLRIDFYESGIGETIIITFPSGGIGVLDGHPSSEQRRPDILSIVSGKKLHFVCLSHPHADHGVDLVRVLQNHRDIDQFWHTIYDIPAFIYGVEQTVNFPSPVREYAAKMNRDWARFLVDIYAAVAERNIPPYGLRSDLQARTVDGVEIHCLSPDQSIQNSFTAAYFKKLTDPLIEVPDPNLLSAVLVLRFGQAVVILGADALRRNWDTVIKEYKNRRLAKALILKVPHHGARNAMNLQRSAPNYLDICSRNPNAKAVLFAGDAKHPDVAVFEKLRSRTDTICLSNGRKRAPGDSNPLRLRFPGARAAMPSLVCNPVVSLDLDQNGDVRQLSGISCVDGCKLEDTNP